MTAEATYTASDARQVNVTVHDSYTGTVVEVTDGPEKFGPTYKFLVVTEDGELISFLQGKPGVERQLTFVKLESVQDMLLQTYRFWKKPMEPGSEKGFFQFDKQFKRPAPPGGFERPAVSGAPGQVVPGASAQGSDTVQPVSASPLIHITPRTPLEDRRAAAQAAYLANFTFVATHVLPDLPDAMSGANGRDQIVFDVNAAVATIMIAEQRG